MAKFRAHKSSLLGGELSPNALGRTDLPQYPAACKTLKNIIPMLSGGGYRRPGTMFEVSFSAATDTAPVLFPFVYSSSVCYAVALSRVIASDAGTITIQQPMASNVSASFSAFTVTGTHPYRMATLADDLVYDEAHDVQTVQSGDIMWMVHPNHKPRKLSRTSSTTFSFTEFDNFSGDQLRDAHPYLRQNATTTTLSFSATTGTITVTASSSIFQTSATAGHVGSVWKVQHGGTVGCFKITAVGGGTSVTATVISTLGGTAAVAEWWEPAWSNYRGWPRAIAFYRGRLVYGGTRSYPDTVWFSEENDYAQLSHSTIVSPTETPAGTQAFTAIVPSKQLNEIQWMVSDKTLFIGTSAEEVIVEPIDASGVFGRDNAKATMQSRYGSSHNQAIRAGNEILFSLRSHDEIRALIFNESEDSYVAEPVQVLYDEKPHPEPLYGNTLNRRFRTFAWDEFRKTLWCLDTAGNLFGLTRDRRLGINAWHSHELGGYDETAIPEFSDMPIIGGKLGIDPSYRTCTGSVISAIVLPNPALGTTDLWLTVKRKVDGVFLYHIERMIGGNIAEKTAYNMSLGYGGNYYTDCSVFNESAYPLTENYVYVGFTHLKGETLVGTANNERGIFELSPVVVDSLGRVTMLPPYPPNITGESTAFAYGLPFTSVIEPVRIEAGSQLGSAQGAVKRIHELTVRFYKTLSAKLGCDEDHLETLVFRPSSTPTGTGTELFTGDKRVKFMGNYDRDGLIYIIQDSPLPFCVVSITAEGILYD